MNQGLQRLGALLVTFILIVAGLMFSVVLLAFIAVAGLIAGIYIWWKTRTLRKMMKAQAGEISTEQEKDSGQIIEGEVIRRVVTLEEFERR